MSQHEIRIKCINNIIIKKIIIFSLIDLVIRISLEL